MGVRAHAKGQYYSLAAIVASRDYQVYRGPLQFGQSLLHGVCGTYNSSTPGFGVCSCRPTENVGPWHILHTYCVRICAPAMFNGNNDAYTAGSTHVSTNMSGALGGGGRDGGYGGGYNRGEGATDAQKPSQASAARRQGVRPLAV